MKRFATILTGLISGSITLAVLAGHLRAEPASRSVDFDELTSADFKIPKAAPALNIPEPKTAAKGCSPYHAPATVCHTLVMTAASMNYSNENIRLSSMHITTFEDYTSAHHYECTPHMAYAETARIDFSYHFIYGVRPLGSDESETIKLCYDFETESPVYEIQSPYEYEIKKQPQPDNARGYVLILSPVRRRPTAPSAEALQLDSFSYDDISGEFRLRLSANFSSLYNGAKVHVGVELVQDKLFDDSLGVKFFELPAAYGKREFTIAFKASDFGGNKDAADRAKAQKYFAKWGFKIKGAAFTDDYTDKGQTPSVSVLK